MESKSAGLGAQKSRLCAPEEPIFPKFRQKMNKNRSCAHFILLKSAHKFDFCTQGSAAQGPMAREVCSLMQYALSSVLPAKQALFFRFHVFNGLLAGYVLHVNCNQTSLGTSGDFLLFGLLRLISRVLFD